MSKKLNCILLVDDNIHDNFFHENAIRENNSANIVVKKESAEKALEYIQEQITNKNALPDLLFLDINMPTMTGWEFLEEYEKLNKEFQSKMIIIILTTSSNPDDEEKARSINIVSDFKTKPLTKEMLDAIIDKYL